MKHPLHTCAKHVLVLALLLGCLFEAPATAAPHRPSVLVLASEQLGPDQLIRWTDVVWTPSGGGSRHTTLVAHHESGAVSSAAMAFLRTHGHAPIDPSVLRGKIRKDRAYEVDDLQADAASRIANAAGAEMVVILLGTADLPRNSQLAQSGMVSAQADVVARLVVSRTGEVLASATSHAARVHINPESARMSALTTATTDCMKNLFDQYQQTSEGNEK